MASKNELRLQLEEAINGETLSPESLAMLVQLLSITDDEQIETAILLDKMQGEKRALSPRFEELKHYYQKIWAYRDRIGGPLAMHQVEWHLEALSLIVRTLELSGRPVDDKTLFAVAATSGIFDKEYISPENQKAWKDERNWRYSKGYQGQDWYDFIGPNSVEKAVTEENRFRAVQFRDLLFSLLTSGFISLDNGKYILK